MNSWRRWRIRRAPADSQITRPPHVRHTVVVPSCGPAVLRPFAVQVQRIKNELALDSSMPILEAVNIAEAMVGCALVDAPTLRTRVDRILAQLE